ncbi:MAG: hypothetical protein GY859_03160 [Desulfobacterales bacterium]|nr:hypothetical protein [Desulfobacterales bacterium]
MKYNNPPKECFGSMGRSMMNGETADNCMTCEAFDKCYKLTMAATMQGIAIDLSLFAENGLASGWLKSFMELNTGPEIKYNA